MKKIFFTIVAAICCFSVASYAQCVYPTDNVKIKFRVNPDGLLEGEFSVSSTKKVQFSRGNLRATTTDLGVTWTWSFATHQYDYVGNASANTSINGDGTVSTNGSVDLFGWVGASSTWGDAAQYGISNSTTTNSTSTYGTGASEALKSDWGNTMGFTWRTLTSDEWNYLFTERTTKTGIRFAKAQVNGVNGVIILPDNWLNSYYVLSYTNDGGKPYNTNVITLTNWTNSLEAHGAVFLPAAGHRKEGTNCSTAGTFGFYWHSTVNDADGAKYLDMGAKNLTVTAIKSRHFGMSVRLVLDVE